MTLAEYMSPERFPLTTQVGLSPDDQLFLDSVNYDTMAEKVKSGEPLTADEQSRWVELQKKVAATDEVIPQIPKRAG